MSEHIKFPSIEQFRNVIRDVRWKAQHKMTNQQTGEEVMDRGAPIPTLKFRGTTKLHGCVHEDTLITLADGSKEKIKDIQKGTSILSYNEETDTVEFDVVNDVIIQNLDKPWVELNFDNGSILKCTADHPILTTLGWIEAINLTNEHELVEES